MPDDPYPHYYRAARDWPQFGVWAGDAIRYDPRRSPEIVVVRYLPPDHSGLLEAVELGVFSRVYPDPDVTSLASARARRADNALPFRKPVR